MSEKIVPTIQALQLVKQFRNQGKKIVLAGGCFDIIHVGHIRFLEKAKEQGDVLFLFLESDEAIKKYKGVTRPVNTQSDRATVLSALTSVDYIIPLSGILSDEEYDRLILAIKPAIIATTKADPYRLHKERQAELSDAKVMDVTDFLQNQSTTHIAKLLQKEL